jgi:transcription initiation factor TFIID subunit TAF12
LAQAQSNQDISSVARFLEMVQSRFGPEIMNILINSEETAAYLAKKFGVPDVLIRDIQERKQLVQMAQEYAQQQAQAQQQQAMQGQTQNMEGIAPPNEQPQPQ